MLSSVEPDDSFEIQSVIAHLCESISALMHDINNNKAPVNMSNLFQKTCHIHSYNT